MSKKISIIIPVYNSENYIANTIESILNQSYKYFEIIIVNDGSTDKSLEICEKYNIKDERIKLVSKRNEGVSQARNSGLQYVTGDYLMFIDSDDYLEENSLKVIAKTMDKYHLDLCIYSWNEVYGGKKKLISLNSDDITFEELYSKILTEDYECGGGFPWNKVWNVKSIIKDSKFIEFRNLKLYEDKLWCLMNLDRLMRKSFKILSIPLYNYRVNANSLSHSNNLEIKKKNNINAIQCAKEIDEYVRKVHPSEKEYSKEWYIGRIFNSIYFDVKCKIADKETYELFHRYKDDFKVLSSSKRKLQKLFINFYFFTIFKKEG